MFYFISAWFPGGYNQLLFLLHPIIIMIWFAYNMAANLIIINPLNPLLYEFRQRYFNNKKRW